MNDEFLRPHGGQDNIAVPTSVVNNQLNEYHGDVNIQNIQNVYQGDHRGNWKPSRRCAAVDFERLSRHFCGRDRELEQLNRVLEAGEGSLRCAIQGISGLGKSHLAIKYGKTSYESGKYTHVFWMSVDTETKLLNGLESILVKLDHPAQLDSDQKAKVEITRRWLEDAEEDQRWLLILDNARRESFESLRLNLPVKYPYGHIIVTTQFEDISKEFVKSQRNAASFLRLPPLEIDDGVALLMASSEMSSETLSDRDQEKARQLVQRTGCHPLAITFAGACATSAGTLPELLDWTNEDQLMMITEYEDALADTDQRVIKQFFDRQIATIQDEVLALELFKTISFLDNSSIPVKMLWRGIQFMQKSDSQADGVSQHSPLFTCRMPQLQKCIQKLASQNLVQVASPGVIGTHDLTNHLSVRSMEDTNVKPLYQSHARRLISSSFESIPEPTKRDNWLASDEVIPHIVKLSLDAENIKSGFDTTLDDAAKYLYNRGRYLESRNLWDCLLIKQKDSLGSTHLDTLTTMQALAEVYLSQSSYREAEEMYNDVLAGRKSQLGDDHLIVLTIMNDLSVVYDRQGRYRESETLCQHVLAQRTKQLGPRHPSTLTAMHNLASTYGARGRFQEAEELYQHVLLEEGKQLGTENSRTLETMNNLALLYVSQGRYREAENFCKQALASKQNQLGPEHPSTLVTTHNLALVYESQGIYREAEDLYRYVLTARRKHLGPAHLVTLTTEHNLATVYERLGRLREAEELFQYVATTRKESLGPAHPDTLLTLHRLADVYSAQARHAEAEQLYHHVLAEQVEQLGAEHPNTLMTKHDLALAFDRQGRFQEAEELCKEVLSSRKELLGLKHPDTLMTMHDLASAYYGQRDYQEAEKLFQHVLAEEEQQLGHEHPNTLLTARNLAALYASQGRDREAEELLVRALVGEERVFGPDHFRTQHVKTTLEDIRRNTIPAQEFH